MTILSRLNSERAINIKDIALNTQQKSSNHELLIPDNRLKEYRDFVIEQIDNGGASWRDWLNLSLLHQLWPQSEPFFVDKEQETKIWHVYYTLLQVTVMDVGETTEKDSIYLRLIHVGRRIFYEKLMNLPSYLYSDVRVWERVKKRIFVTDSVLNYDIDTLVGHAALLKEAYPKRFADEIAPYIERAHFEQELLDNVGKTTWPGHLECFRILFPEWRPSLDLLNRVKADLHGRSPSSHLDNAFTYGVLSCNELHVGEDGVRFTREPQEQQQEEESLPTIRQF